MLTFIKIKSEKLFGISFIIDSKYLFLRLTISLFLLCLFLCVFVCIVCYVVCFVLLYPAVFFANHTLSFAIWSEVLQVFRSSTTGKTLSRYSGNIIFNFLYIPVMETFHVVVNWYVQILGFWTRLVVNRDKPKSQVWEWVGPTTRTQGHNAWGMGGTNH